MPAEVVNTSNKLLMGKRNHPIYMIVIPIVLTVCVIFLFPPFIDSKWASFSIHSTVELLGVLCMVFLSFIFLNQFSFDKKLWRILTAIGLSGMGVTEAFYAVGTPGNPFILIYLLSGLGGSFWFMLSGTDKQVNRAAVFKRIYWINMILFTLFGILVLTFGDFVPIMQTDGKLTDFAVSISLLTGLFYFIAVYKFYGLFIRNNKSEFRILSVAFLLFGTASFIFIGSHTWGPGWWFWHMIRLAAFITLIYVISLEYEQSADELPESASRMSSSQDYFCRLINLTAEGISGLDLNGNCVFCNQAGLRILGYKNVSEILDKNLHDLVHRRQDGSRYQMEECKICRAITEGRDAQISGEVFQRKNKSFLDVECCVHPIFINKKKMGSVLLFSDITEKKMTENLILENQKKFRDLIERSNDGIYVLQDNQFVFINPMFTQILGFELEDISGDDFELAQILPEESITILDEREEKFNRGEKIPNRYELKSYTKSGETVDISISIGHIDWEGKPAILGIIRDESEQIKHRNELIAALHKAEEGQRLKTFFLANISHELRTPLNAIIGFTDLIKNETRHLVDDSMRDFFDIIEQSSNRLMNTVGNILNISLLETGEIDYIPKLIDLVDIVERTVKMANIDAERKHLKLVFDNQVRSVPVLADENILFNAITNLIDNAIKYTDKGQVSVRLEEDNEFIHLTISDTGIGMSKEYISNLYETFSQESEGFSKKYQGIGLGLAITKRSLDLHNVDVSVESKKGVGTTFKLRFLPSISGKGAQA